ncbi:hypothetical protein [Escherichia coli]|uniref:hypothetical protein n=1 Tax=Escherichia coli TaxID=562 RepID=UPI001330361C|nr:hypothetical protein [Escherichia coli]
MNKTKGCLIANFATVPLTELKKYRKSPPEKMAFSYSYALSRGVDTQFRHINIAEADHFKQFLRQIKRAGLDIRAIC